jgi:hypothetical protein
MPAAKRASNPCGSNRVSGAEPSAGLPSMASGVDALVSVGYFQRRALACPSILYHCWFSDSAVAAPSHGCAWLAPAQGGLSVERAREPRGLTAYITVPLCVWRDPGSYLKGWSAVTKCLATKPGRYFVTPYLGPVGLLSGAFGAFVRVPDNTPHALPQESEPCARLNEPACAGRRCA